MNQSAFVVHLTSTTEFPSTCADLAALDQSNLTVFPPPVANDSIVNIIAMIYSLLFFMGFFGNLVILSYIYFIQKTLGESLVSKDNIFIYTISLSVVDLCVSLSLPTTVVHLLLNNWIFGTVICKVHWILESVSKTMSTFILTAVSFDRYVAICHPIHAKRFRTSGCAMKIIFTALVLSLGLLFPLVYNATERKVFYTAPFKFKTFYGQTKTGCIQAVSCQENLSLNLVYAFTIYMFVLGFFLPGVLTTYFYGRMLTTVKSQTRKLCRSQIPVGQIVRYTVGVTMFYFVCWVPYWISILSRLILPIPRHYGIVIVMWTIHALPFLNSSLNWIFYGLLNSQLRRYYKEATNAIGPGSKVQLNNLAHSVIRSEMAMGGVGLSDLRCREKGRKFESTSKFMRRNCSSFTESSPILDVQRRRRGSSRSNGSGNMEIKLVRNSNDHHRENNDNCYTVEPDQHEMILS